MPRMISTNVGGSLPVQSKPLILWHRSMSFVFKVLLGRLGSLWCQVEQELAKAEKGYLKDMQQVGMLKVVSWWCHRYVWVWHGMTRDAAALLLPGQEQTDFDENLVDLAASHEMKWEKSNVDEARCWWCAQMVHHILNVLMFWLVSSRLELWIPSPSTPIWSTSRTFLITSHPHCDVCAVVMRVSLWRCFRAPGDLWKCGEPKS